MIRKESALDGDRPHYYSQFWIDVASGKRDLGPSHTATAEAESEPSEEPLGRVEAIEPAETAIPKPVRPARPKAEPKRVEPVRPALTSLADLAKIDSLMKSSAEMDDDTVPDIESAGFMAPETEEAVVTDFDPNALEEAEPAVPDEAVFGDLEYDEEDDWGEDEDQPRRGSKPSKRQRREPRREF
jgi:hypothetical protein